MPRVQIIIAWHLVVIQSTNDGMALHILLMLMRVGAGVVVVTTAIAAAGQQTICLRPIDPHIAGKRLFF